MNKKEKSIEGGINFSEGVIVKIAEIAATECRGVASIDGKLKVPENEFKAPKFLAFVTDRMLSPIKVKMLNEAVAIEAYIIVKEDANAAVVGAAVQSHIKASVQNMAGIPVSKVNVYITGIECNVSDAIIA